jgi:hypothetical protein
MREAKKKKAEDSVLRVLFYLTALLLPFFFGALKDLQ